MISKVIQQIGSRLVKKFTRISDNTKEAFSAYQKGDISKLEECSDKFAEEALINAGLLIAQKLGAGICDGDIDNVATNVVSSVTPVLGGVVLTNVAMAGITRLAIADIKDSDINKEDKTVDIKEQLFGLVQQGLLDPTRYQTVISELEKGNEEAAIRMAVDSIGA